MYHIKNHITSVVYTEDELFEWEWTCPECGERHMSLTEGPESDTQCESCDEPVELVMQVN